MRKELGLGVRGLRFVVELTTLIRWLGGCRLEGFRAKWAGGAWRERIIA
jgi:hypothetical protein